MRWLVHSVVGVVLVVAAVFISSTGVHDHSVLRIVAAIIVALPGAVGVRLGRRNAREVNAMLTKKLRDLVRHPMIRTQEHVDALAMSLHVWEVPVWYRVLFPYWLRKWAKRFFSEDFREDHGRRPKLDRTGYMSFDRKPPSGINFRRNKGMVGVCLDRNQPGVPVWVDFESPKFQEALASNESWNSAGNDITRGLRYDAAKSLAERYSRAVALVVQDESSGEPLGCLTWSLPKGATLSESDMATILNDVELASTASLIAVRLSFRIKSTNMVE